MEEMVGRDHTRAPSNETRSSELSSAIEHGFRWIGWQAYDYAYANNFC